MKAIKHKKTKKVKKVFVFLNTVLESFLNFLVVNFYYSYFKIGKVLILYLLITVKESEVAIKIYPLILVDFL